jgi:hypothetical protein
MKENLLVKTVCAFALTFVVSSFSFLRCSAQPGIMELDTLEINNVRAYINPITPFLNEKNHLNLFEVPKNSGKNTIYSSNIWIGGMDEQDNLHLAAHRFCQNGYDFWLGPITNDVISDEYKQKYHHTWKVSKEEIEYHKLHYSDASYVMPWAIANWPAHGRTLYGESYILAPYQDMSGSDSYTPLAGDYPKIRGDQAVFFILNDAGVHTETGGIPLNFEILGMAYAYNASDSALDNTIFLSYLLRNKSSNDYKDFYLGFWTDFDIGYAFDDYVGCDTLLNLAYGYNGYEIDGTGEIGAYGEHPPAQGTLLLNQKMDAFVYYNNTGSPVNGEPRKNKPEDTYNYLRGFWLNGEHITYGGTGHNPESTDYTNFMFSGDPVTGTGWTEFTPDGPGSDPNKPDDRRGLMSAGPFTFPAGESMCFDIALPFARDYEGDNISSVALLKQYAQTIQQFYDNQNFENNCAITVGIKENTVYNDKLLLYPNPSDGQFTATCEFVIENIELYDMLGRKVFEDTPKVRTAQINAQLSQGLYIYRVILENNTTRSGKIVVR